MLNRISAPAPRHAGRHRAPPRRRRLAVTAPGLALITIATLAALAGCSSGASSSGSLASGASSGHGGSVAAAPSAAASAAASAPESGAAYAASGTTSSGVAKSGYPGGGAAQDSSARSISGGQQLIYTAQLAVRAQNVGAALSTATSIVTAAGGYVSAENTSGTGSGTGSGSAAAASQATADVTLKIPAAVYPATLAKLTGAGLGTQLSLRQQAQDVTQQVADVGSLVASDEAAITQLRALLKDAGSVANLLVVQDQINTETSNLESMLAQQQALDHETAYATVTLTLVGPKAAVKAKAKHKPAPPPGLASGLTGGWRAFRLTVDWLLAIVGAVAPFAAIVVVIAGGAWWVRRRMTRGASAAGESGGS
jgi:Domain of unknown function (DUF4349)